MQEKLFRKVALDRLSSPDQLDQLMKITNPRGWLALFALIALTATALAWLFLGYVPVKGDGHGVLSRGRPRVILDGRESRRLCQTNSRSVNHPT